MDLTDPLLIPVIKTFFKRLLPSASFCSFIIQSQNTFPPALRACFTENHAVYGNLITKGGGA